MTWIWSHTGEAYQNVSNQIEIQDDEWLNIVWAEIQSVENEDDLNEDKYQEMLKKVKELSKDQVIEEIQEFTHEHHECTNGGWRAYCCPFNCSSHTVLFSEEIQ